MDVTVHIRRRSEIVDPHGATVKKALEALGHSSVTSVRLDRTVHMVIDGEDADLVRAQVVEMCDELLTNPVLEDYEVVIQ